MRSMVAALALLVTASTAVAAQQAKPHTREGFTIGFGFGFGSAGIDCDLCDDDDRETGLSGYFRIGGAIRPNLILAAETNGWTKDEDGVTSTIGFLSGVAQWYPQVSNGFYAKGGLGLGSITLDDGTDELTSRGVGLTLGAGYDFRVGKNFSLTPYVNLLTTLNGDAKINGTDTDEKLTTSIFQIGLGFTWH